jgi:predicted nucleic acid-binding protein
MSAERISLDTNILFYAVDRDSGKRHGRAQELIKESALHQDCLLILQVLGEFFAAVTRKKQMTHEEAQAQVQDWQILFTIMSATPTTLRKALQAVTQHRLSFWDAMIWAVAREAGVTRLFSEDFQHDRVLEGVRFVNPFLVKDPFD